MPIPNQSTLNTVLSYAQEFSQSTITKRVQETTMGNYIESCHPLEATPAMVLQHSTHPLWDVAGRPPSRQIHYILIIQAWHKNQDFQFLFKEVNHVDILMKGQHKSSQKHEDFSCPLKRHTLGKETTLPNGICCWGREILSATPRDPAHHWR